MKREVSSFHFGSHKLLHYHDTAVLVSWEETESSNMDMDRPWWWTWWEKDRKCIKGNSDREKPNSDLGMWRERRRNMMRVRRKFEER